MKYIVLITLVRTFCLNATAQTGNLKKNRYNIEVLPKQQQLRITAQFTAGNTTETAIQLPKEFGDFRDAWRYVENISVTPSKKQYRQADDSSVLIIRHFPKQLLTLKYTLKNSLIDSIPGREPAYSIIIKPLFYHIPGQVLFAYPKNDSASMVNVQVNWLQYPVGWSQTNSFGNKQLTQKIANLKTDEFISSIWTGGDFRVYSFRVNNKPVHFAIRGNDWKFQDSAMFSLIKKTISFQRAFWNDYNINEYTITLLPFLTENEFNENYQGTGLTNSFATWATTNNLTQPQSLYYLYNHELMHHWIGHIIENDQPEELLYWFSEGFTDYFSWRNMLQNGFIDSSSFRKNFNELMAFHYADSIHESPNSSIKTFFWTDYRFQKLPYNRGRLLATYLNYLILKNSAGKKNLKNVLLELLEVCPRKKRKITTNLFIEIANKYTGQNISTLIDEYITNGKFISFEHCTSKRRKNNFQISSF